MRPIAFACALAVTIVAAHAPAADAQRDNLRKFMQAKLGHSQDIVEGLALGDFQEIDRGAQKLSLLSLAETWQVMQTPQYIDYSKKFRMAADALSAAAKNKDLDKATKQYSVVLTNCVECHKYLRDIRMARLDVK